MAAERPVGHRPVTDGEADLAELVLLAAACREAQETMAAAAALPLLRFLA